MLTKEQLDTIIKETQIKEKLQSPRQVLEKYPELNAIYNMACDAANGNIDTNDIPFASPIPVNSEDE